jgi:hypothetical protein
MHLSLDARLYPLACRRRFDKFDNDDFGGRQDVGNLFESSINILILGLKLVFHSMFRHAACMHACTLAQTLMLSFKTALHLVIWCALPFGEIFQSTSLQPAWKPRANERFKDLIAPFPLLFVSSLEPSTIFHAYKTSSVLFSETHSKSIISSASLAFGSDAFSRVLLSISLFS